MRQDASERPELGDQLGGNGSEQQVERDSGLGEITEAMEPRALNHVASAS
jgi:hypothetical protein